MAKNKKKRVLLRQYLIKPITKERTNYENRINCKQQEAMNKKGKYQQYTEAQEKSLINFILWAKSKNRTFDLDYITGHDELRKEAGKTGDKQDPGGSLSMPMQALRDLVKTKAIALWI